MLQSDFRKLADAMIAQIGKGNLKAVRDFKKLLTHTTYYHYLNANSILNLCIALSSNGSTKDINISLKSLKISLDDLDTLIKSFQAEETPKQVKNKIKEILLDYDKDYFLMRILLHKAKNSSEALYDLLNFLTDPSRSYRFGFFRFIFGELIEIFFSGSIRQREIIRQFENDLIYYWEEETWEKVADDPDPSDPMARIYYRRELVTHIHSKTLREFLGD